MGKPNHGNRNTRDLGFGAGKGDAPRGKFDEAWRASYDAINWLERVCPIHPKYRALREPVCNCVNCWEIWQNQGLDGFVREGNRLIKRYQ